MPVADAAFGEFIDEGVLTSAMNYERSGLLLEQVECAAGFEVFGDTQAECAGGDRCWNFAGEADHALAVGRDDLRLNLPCNGCAGVGDGVCDIVDGGAVDADRELATAAEGVEHGTFGLDRETGRGVVERGHGAADEVIVGGIGKDGIRDVKR